MDAARAASASRRLTMATELAPELAASAPPSPASTATMGLLIAREIASAAARRVAMSSALAPDLLASAPPSTSTTPAASFLPAGELATAASAAAPAAARRHW